MNLKYMYKNLQKKEKILMIINYDTPRVKIKQLEQKLWQCIFKKKKYYTNWQNINHLMYHKNIIHDCSNL